MLDVEVPSTTATRPAPYFSRAVCTASKKPSCCSPCHASRLLRHSQCARPEGSGSDSMPATRPMNVSSGDAVKSLRASPLRRVRRDSRIAPRPLPAAHEAVNAAMESGAARMGESGGAVFLNVVRQRAQRGEDAAVLFVIRAELEAVALRDLQRQLQG